MHKRSRGAAVGLGSALAFLALAAPAHAVTMSQLQMGQFAIDKGVFNVVFAKEVCSCMFVDGLTLQECTDPIRDNLPSVATSLVNISVDPVNQTVTSSYKGADEINAALASLGITVASVAGPASARFDGDRYGCVLTQLPADAPSDAPSSPGATGSGDAGSDAETMDAAVDASTDPDAAGDPSPAPDCGQLADGQYCGDDGIDNGDPATLYACAGGSLAAVQVCTNGCLANFGMDACN